jgi:Uri superfamily endonuclease
MYPMKSPSDARGSYVLIIQLQAAAVIDVGSLGLCSFPSGYYAYVGSAMGGLKPRLRRHLKKNKTPHWHIDYLTNIGTITTIAVFESKQKLECHVAQYLKQQFSPVPNFGCGDCDCTSHLFFASHEKEIKSGVKEIHTETGVKGDVLGHKGINVFLGLR